ASDLIPASACLRTTSSTASATRCASAAASTGTPSSLAYIIRMRSSGRGRLPVCVVRKRSVLRLITHSSTPDTLGPIRRFYRITAVDDARLGTLISTDSESACPQHLPRRGRSGRCCRPSGALPPLLGTDRRRHCAPTTIRKPSLSYSFLPQLRPPRHFLC